MSRTQENKFAMISVYPRLRDEMREVRDAGEFSEYSDLVEAMLEQFDPDEYGTN